MFKRGDYVKIISKSYGFDFESLKFGEGYVHNIPGTNLVCVTKEKLSIGELSYPTPYGYFLEKDLKHIHHIDLSEINSSFEELLNVL